MSENPYVRLEDQRNPHTQSTLVIHKVHKSVGSWARAGVAHISENCRKTKEIREIYSSTCPRVTHFCKIRNLIAF